MKNILHVVEFCSNYQCEIFKLHFENLFWFSIHEFHMCQNFLHNFL